MGWEKLQRAASLTSRLSAAGCRWWCELAVRFDVTHIPPIQSAIEAYVWGMYGAASSSAGEDGASCNIM